MRTIFEVVKRPVVSEKSLALMEVANRYVFEVAYEATKPEIRDAIAKLFNVKVKKVRTQIAHGRSRRVGAHMTKKPNRKKAIITLEEGQKIEIFQNK